MLDHLRGLWAADPVETAVMVVGLALLFAWLARPGVRWYLGIPTCHCASAQQELQRTVPAPWKGQPVRSREAGADPPRAEIRLHRPDGSIRDLEAEPTEGSRPDDSDPGEAVGGFLGRAAALSEDEIEEYAASHSHQARRLLEQQRAARRQEI